MFTLFCIQYFGVRKDKLPSIAIQDKDEHKYILEEAYPGKIRMWFKDYFVSSFTLIGSNLCILLHVIKCLIIGIYFEFLQDGKLSKFDSSKSKAEYNYELVRDMFIDTIGDVVFRSLKNGV